MTVTLEHPVALAILLLAIPFWWMARRSVAVLGAWKAWGGLALRIVVLLLLTFAVARPSVVRETDAMTVLVVADASDSVPSSCEPPPTARCARRWSARNDPRTAWAR